MRHVLLTVALCGLAAPAFAATMTIDNRSSVSVASVNSYPVGADGEAIEDNVGGLYDSVLPGNSATFEVTSDCGPTLFLVGIEGAGPDGDLRIEVDTCEATTLIVGD